MGTGELPVFLPWIPTPEGAAGGTTLGVTGATGTGLPANSFTIVGVWWGRGALSLTGRAGPREGTGPHLEPVLGVRWYPLHQMN